MILLAIIILGLHLFAMNVLYPKIIGKRLQLNPLTVTIALVVLGMAMGSDGIDPRDSGDGSNQDRAGPRGRVRGIRALDGRIVSLRTLLHFAIDSPLLPS